MNKTFKFLKLVGVLIAILILTYVVGILIAQVGLNINDPSSTLYLVIVTQILYGLCALFLIRRKDKESAGPYIKNKGLKADSWKMIFIGLGAAGFGNILISTVISLLADSKLVKHSIDLVTTVLGTTDTKTLVIQIILVVIIAPIVEELLFRGYIFTETKKIYSLAVSVVLNGFLFGLYHMNLLQGINTFFLSIVLSLIYYYRRNITDVILVHAINNLTSLSSYLPEKYIGIVGIVTMVSLIIGAYFLYTFIKEEKNKEVETYQ